MYSGIDFHRSRPDLMSFEAVTLVILEDTAGSYDVKGLWHLWLASDEQRQEPLSCGNRLMRFAGHDIQRLGLCCPLRCEAF